MRTNHFSAYKQPGAVRVSNFRRISHSVSNKIRSTKGSRLPAAGGAALSGAGYASSGATIATGVVETASAGWGVAAGASAGTAVVTVASGPVVAAGLTMIGLVLAAKSAYSNREKAHDKLNGYVWTYIDDTRPTKQLEDDAKIAATRLVMEGKSQAKILADKLASREKKWQAFVQKFMELTNPHMNWHNSFQRLNDAQKQEVAYAVCETHNDATELYQKAISPGGAVPEFMRRLIHAGNYVQSYRIFAKIMVGDNSPLEDFGNDENAAKYRSELARLSDRIDKVIEVERTMQEYFQTQTQISTNPVHRS